MFELGPYLESKRRVVNGYLEESLSWVAYQGRLMDAMTYSLMAGGKRLRPILCLAGAEAVGGSAEDALPAACALEMIHTYSLIHDDLPAMDNDELRRGKPTCHIAFDEATAILAGDALLTMAFEMLSTDNSAHTRMPDRWLAVVARIARAAGSRGMVEGQVRDIAAENTELSLDDLARLHSLKTGALIQASVCSGAVLGGGTEAQIDRLETYARNIGFAFQVKDDVLNVEGDPELLGKNVGTDELRHKSTYPFIMGLDKSKAFAQELIEAAISALDAFDHRSDPLRAIAKYIIERKR